jgi:hypothetical protein
MLNFFNSFPKPVWERHLAAIFESFESVFNPPQRLADKSATKNGGQVRQKYWQTIGRLSVYGGLDAFLR